MLPPPLLPVLLKKLLDLIIVYLFSSAEIEIAPIFILK